MKSILYFLLGVSISWALVLQASAEDCCPKDFYSTYAASYFVSNYPTHARYDLGQSYTTSTDAIAALGSGIVAGEGSTANYSAAAYINVSSDCVSATKRCYWRVNNITKKVYYLGMVTTICADPPPCPEPVDSDGDGLFDYQDPVPLDPSPHKWYLLTEYKQGDQLVGRMVLLDNDSVQLFGQGSESGATPWVTITGEWRSQASFNENFALDPCGDQHAPMRPGDQGYPDVSGVPEPSDLPFADDMEDIPGTGSGGGGEPGEYEGPDADAGGDDTTEVSGINNVNSNLGTINENLKGIGAILDGILDQGALTNANLQALREGQEKQSTAIGEGLGGIGDALDGIGATLNGGGDGGAGDQAEQAFEDGVAGDGDFYTDTNFKTDYVEGTDFDAAPELEDQGWLTSFISSNPLAVALNNSGFQTSGSDCSMTADLGSFGVKTISLCDFYSEFQAAGLILYGISALGALLMIGKGV